MTLISSVALRLKESFPNVTVMDPQNLLPNLRDMFEYLPISLKYLMVLDHQLEVEILKHIQDVPASHWDVHAQVHSIPFILLCIRITAIIVKATGTVVLLLLYDRL